MIDFRVGFGYDSHRFAPDRPLVIGGIVIPYELGLAAHSDGDVLIHAVCDALLGALALGDIGHLFPDSDPAWKGIDSKLLLGKVVSMAAGLGWSVGNVDITIALQKPKIGSYVPQMRATLAGVLGVGEDCVSIKATTNERLGFVGRCEGCQVWATALLYR